MAHVRKEAVENATESHAAESVFAPRFAWAPKVCKTLLTPEVNKL